MDGTMEAGQPQPGEMDNVVSMDNVSMDDNNSSLDGSGSTATSTLRTPRVDKQLQLRDADADVDEDTAMSMPTPSDCTATNIPPSIDDDPSYATFEYRFPPPPAVLSRFTSTATGVGVPVLDSDPALVDPALVDRALLSPDLAPFLPNSLAASHSRNPAFPFHASNEISLVHIASFTNLHVATAIDALVLVQACRMGIGRLVGKRPTLEQRENAITSGTVFVFQQGTSGIKRWTDGRRWTPSRVNGVFLVYRETDPDASTTQTGRSTRTPSSTTSTTSTSTDPPDKGKRSEAFNNLLPHGLVKKAISIPSGLLLRSPPTTTSPPTSTPTPANSYHLVHYFRPSDVGSGKLRQPSQLHAFDEIKAHAMEWARESGMVVDGNEGVSLELGNEEFAAVKAAGAGGAGSRKKSGESRGGSGSGSGSFEGVVVGETVGRVLGDQDIFAKSRHAMQQRHAQRKGGGGGVHAHATAPMRFLPSPAPAATCASFPIRRPRANSIQFPAAMPPQRPDEMFFFPPATMEPRVRPRSMNVLDQFLAAEGGYSGPGVPEFAYPTIHFDKSSEGVASLAAFAPHDSNRRGGTFQHQPAVFPTQQDDSRMQGPLTPLTQLASAFDNTLNPHALLASPVAPGTTGSSPGWTTDHLGRPMMQPYPTFPALDSIEARNGEMGMSVPPTTDGTGSFFPELAIAGDPMLSTRVKRTITEVSSSGSGTGSGTDSDADLEKLGEIGVPSHSHASDEEWSGGGEPLFSVSGQEGVSYVEYPARASGGYDWFATNSAAFAAEAAATLAARNPSAVAAIPGLGSPMVDSRSPALDSRGLDSLNGASGRNGRG